MAIEQWVLDNHLTFNTSKCNYMMLSRKRFPTTPFHPLMLTPHITSVCSKAKQILGLLYRRFYNYAEGDRLKQLYLSLKRPHLEYACPVWDPYTTKDKKNFLRISKNLHFGWPPNSGTQVISISLTLWMCHPLQTPGSSLNFPCSVRLSMVCAISPQTSFVLVVIIVMELTTLLQIINLLLTQMLTITPLYHIQFLHGTHYTKNM